MEQSAAAPPPGASSPPPGASSPPPGASSPPGSAAAREHDPAFAAIVASIDRLDDLGIADERGLATVEPASEFHWP